MRKITLAFVSFLLSATGTLFAQHAKKYADLTLEEYNSEYAEMKKSDDFSVDARGNVTKFKKTLPNLCTIVWEGGTTHGKYTLDVTITSYDGDVYQGAVRAERYNSVNEGIKYIFSNFKRDDGEKKWSITKDVPLEDMWFLGDDYSGTPDGIITFADKTKSPIKRDPDSKTIRVPLKHAGDYYEKVLALDSIDGGKVIWKDKGWTGTPFRVTLEDGIFIINSGNYLDKTIIYNNGDVYKGAIWYHKNDSLGIIEGDLERGFSRAKLLKANKISDIGRPWYGDMTKADGTIVVIRSGEEDEFETIKRTKIAQAKIKEEKAAAKQQAALNQKYGKKYVDAMLKGQVIIGMPEELIQLGIIVDAFLPHFNIMTTSIDYGNGNVCKDLTLVSTSRLKNVGYIWFNGGKVSSIVYY